MKRINTMIKRSTASPIPKTAIEQATTALQDLPEKPKEQWSLREAVNLMRDSINDALNKGYTYDEVAAMLTGQGVQINVQSLKYYLTRGKKEEKEGLLPTKTRKTRRPRAAKVADSAMSIVESESSTDTPLSLLQGADATETDAPAKPRRGRAAKSTTTAKTRTPRTPRSRSKAALTLTSSAPVESNINSASPADDQTDSGASGPGVEETNQTQRRSTTRSKTAAKSKPRTSTRAKTHSNHPRKTRQRKGTSPTE
ncbi:MAG: hypothetical protein HC881_13490 [Leptolyngbyaceae cyanobacterium SL_7_1]|nr:hypothetical protein [Leptolyngbyaceae cyanobacterium SL_7_1]